MSWLAVRAGILTGVRPTLALGDAEDRTPNFPGRLIAAACCRVVGPNSDGLAGASSRNEAKISLSSGPERNFPHTGSHKRYQ
jgi:hypothetical protein